MKWRHVKSRSDDEAQASLEEAQAALDATRGRRIEVERAAFTLRAYRIENHFAEAIAATMRRQP